MILQTKMETLRAAVQAEMRDALGLNGDAPDSIHQMMHYHMGWADAAFEPAEVPTGKLIRPILALLVCEAAGGDWPQALPAAAAIEILHNFSLVHDDIEDGSPTRRGRDTVWKLWGEPLAINVGDGMFAEAQLSMVRLAERGVPADVVVTAMRRFNETCVELTQGQQADMQFEQRDDVTAAEYLAMIQGKTAVLVAFSAEIGARIAGADGATVEHYRQYGLETGLAFQVIDDILGIWGDEETIGKSAESDILTKKKTLPVLYALERSADLRTHYEGAADAPGFVAEAVRLLDSAEARAYSEGEASAYSESAIGHLRAANPQGEAATAIDQLTTMLLQRDA